MVAKKKHKFNCLWRINEGLFYAATLKHKLDDDLFWKTKKKPCKEETTFLCVLQMRDGTNIISKQIAED